MRTRVRKLAVVLSLGAVMAAAFPRGEATSSASAQATATETAARAGAVVPAGDAELNLVFVLDGLRPDSINPTDTPNLFRLRNEGVNFTNSHAVAPTVTRLNSSAIGTGRYPTTSGIVGNSMYVPEVNPTRAFSTGEAQQLLALRERTGRIVLAETVAQRMQAEGKELVALGSGSSGSSLLLNPSAPDGAGVMINGDDPATGAPLAFPAEVGVAITARFGPPPSKRGVSNNSASVDWAMRVLTDYVIPDLRPDVVLTWMTEPDGIQHRLGAGAAEAIETIRNDDRNIGLVLQKLGELGLAERTNMIFVSDHGFSQTSRNVGLEERLVEAGLKQDVDDVVVAETGSSLVYVKDRDPKRIEEIVGFLQGQEYADAIYTAARRPEGGRYTSVRPDVRTERLAEGWVEGTFSLELIGEANPERGADILVTYPWTSQRNEYGIPGSAVTGAGSGPAGNHGSFSPWDITNTFFAWGADVKDGDTSLVPAGNVDIAPTLLALTGTAGADALDGRVLAEALDGGPDPARVAYRTQVFETTARRGAYRTQVQVSEAGGTRYVDQSQRLAP